MALEMNKDPDKPLRDEMDRVFEGLRARAKQLGIDTTDKTMAEIQKLLSDLPD